MLQEFKYQNTNIELPTVKSVIRWHGCAGWSGFTLVVKANQFLPRQVMGKMLSFTFYFSIDGKLMSATG
jgi:hypothetical protein